MEVVQIINFNSKAVCEHFASNLAASGRKEVGKALRLMSGNKPDHKKIGIDLASAVHKIRTASQFMLIDRNEDGTAKMENGQPVIITESKAAKS